MYVETQHMVIRNFIPEDADDLYEILGDEIDHAFKEGNAHKIFAETIDAWKSVHLMEKLGMKLEGIQREQVRDLQGNWKDLYFYGILRNPIHHY